MTIEPSTQNEPASPDADRRTGQLVLAIVLSTLGGSVLAVLFVGSVFLFATTLLPGLIAFAFTVVLMVAVGFAIVRWHAARQRAFLWTLHVAVRRRMPLAAAVRAFSRERLGFTAYQAAKLAEILEEGVPLPMALEYAQGLVSAEARAILRVGYESGALSAALAQEVENRRVQEPVWTPVLGRLLYLAGVTLFMGMVASFMMLKIIPAFEKIFDDFGVELPAMTLAAISASSFAAQFWPLVLLFVVLIVLPLFVIGVLRMAGLIRFGVPGFGWLTRRLHTAAILEALGLTARQGRPLVEALQTLAAWYPVPAVRRRLADTAADVEAGADWCEVLHVRGLIGSADRAVLEAAQRAGNLTWAMREMADSNRRRHLYRTQLWVQVLFPPVVVFFGCVVGYFVVAFFIPLISLIQNLT